MWLIIVLQSISIRFNLFQSDLIVKSKHGEIGEDFKAAPEKVRYQYMAKNQN